MITSVEIGDFLAHSNSKIEFENGVTVFVGENGAGKSSIIDAITFGLFGEHTRKSNKGLIRRGTNQGFAKVTFSVKDKKYEAVRKIDSKGTLSAKFSEIRGEDNIEIAAGERKQFGESMTSEVEKIIGLDFEKLKIASIVQQGELNTIINAKPKEFKELLNAIIGINKLDIASESMKGANKEFRENIRKTLGYDDTHIEILSRELEKCEEEIKQAEPERKQLESSRKKIQDEISEARKKIEIESPKIDKKNQLESRKKELVAYAKQVTRELEEQIMLNERKIQDCRNCFELVGVKKELDSKMNMAQEAIEEATRKIQEMTNQIASLKERKLLAVKLQLKDNKCPVCDSKVEKLNPFFQEEHLISEIQSLQDSIATKEKEKKMYEQKYKEFSEKLQQGRDAEATLRIHSISSKEELEKIEKEITIQKENFKRCSLSSEIDLLEIGKIDNHAEMILEIIKTLEKETSGFNQDEFENLKQSVNDKQMRLSQMDQKIGAISEKISKDHEKVKTNQKIISELRIVKKYTENLDAIQSAVFSRDGPVATSLRSWALNTVSAKASEYLTLLNTKIQRISLSEKLRDISITCYSKKETLDLESLSGGEKVSVALSLRLGMASLLGASNLNLMILDEPTTHLDSERKKSLVGVLSQLSNISNQETNPMQFIIITHDAEIFEDSTVERIYKFESSDNGTKIIAV